MLGLTFSRAEITFLPTESAVYEGLSAHAEVLLTPKTGMNSCTLTLGGVVPSFHLNISNLTFCCTLEVLTGLMLSSTSEVTGSSRF